MTRAYLSHPIRGPKGASATAEEIESNNKDARFMGLMLRELFPELELYVPGDQDQCITYLYLKGYVTTAQILEADCSIIDGCDFMIMFDPFGHVSEGMHHEMDHCLYTSTPFIHMRNGLDEKVRVDINGLINYFEDKKDE